MTENNSVKLKINGQEVEASKGSTVLEAARTAGIEIPHFCYHPTLELVGSCRMCQVEFVAGERTFLGVSCRTTATDGMEVLTHTESAVRARAGVLEFLLANHPLDCAICDKAGECPLQDYTYDHGFTEGRTQESRRTGIKKTPLGGHIIFDSERCILCTRCVRFMTDYAKAPQLCVSGRGDKSQISTFPGRQLDSNYTGNLADICPVGALTLEEFRFACRSWNLESTPTVCPYCTRGCNVFVDVREVDDSPRRHNRVLRVRPRENPDVHGAYICNEGRFRPLETHKEKRLTAPLLKGQPADLDSVIEAAAAGLKEQGGRLLVITSPMRSLEELYLIKTVFEPLAGDKIVALQPEQEGGDKILRTEDPAANIEACDVLDIPLVSIDELADLIAGGDVDALFQTVPAISLSDDLAKNLRHIVYLGHLEDDTAAMADVAIPGQIWLEKEGTFINFQGRVQRFRPAIRPPASGIIPDLDSLARLGRAMGAEEIRPEPALLFARMADELKVLSGLTYADLGDSGALLADDEGEES